MHLTLHLTAKCNLRCRYCYASPHEGPDMSFDTAKKAINLAIGRVKKNDSLGIVFFGGEPLLMRELIEKTVRHCHKIEQETGQLFHYKITTNGTLLDEEFLTHPDTSEILVALSHDGIQCAHDAHRVDLNGTGSFDRLDSKIDLLLKHKPYSPVMMVINPNTVEHYAESVQWLFDRGFHYLICTLNYGADWNEKDLARLKRQYDALADWYYEKTMAEEKFYFSPFEVKMASHIFPGSCKAERCELGQTQISVAPDGLLYPCVQFVGDTTYAIGNVDEGLDEDTRMRLYSINSQEKNTCTGCAIRERCNHYCGCLNKQTTGSIDKVSPILCAHERIVLPIADKLAASLFKKRSPMFIQKHYNEMFPLISLVEDKTSTTR